LSPISPPNRSASGKARAAMLKRAELDPTTTQPSHLAHEDIKQEPDLFQPRYDSIAYSPGRSETHIAELAKIARRGQELDPVTVAAFGDEWFLIDGHHRLAAYQEAGWTKPIPVNALQSELRGEERITWAVEMTFADNAKNRLNMNTADKVDGAWRAISRKTEQSKAHAKRTFGVSDGTVAAMRRVRDDLEEAGRPAEAFPSWRMAKSELRRLKEDDGEPRDFDQMWDMQKRHIARRLKPVMEMNLSPESLAEALEAYSPGIVQLMAETQGTDRFGFGDDDDDL
jgi:hypothetical protein